LSELNLNSPFFLAIIVSVLQFVISSSQHHHLYSYHCYHLDLTVGTFSPTNLHKNNESGAHGVLEELGYFLQIVILWFPGSLNVDSVYAILAALQISIEAPLPIPPYRNRNAIQVENPFFKSSHQK
jgi:hypothetical protein